MESEEASDGLWALAEVVGLFKNVQGAPFLTLGKVGSDEGEKHLTFRLNFFTSFCGGAFCFF